MTLSKQTADQLNEIAVTSRYVYVVRRNSLEVRTAGDGKLVGSVGHEG